MAYMSGGGHGEGSEKIVLECDDTFCKFNTTGQGYEEGKRVCNKVRLAKMSADHLCKGYVESNNRKVGEFTLGDEGVRGGET